MLQLAALLAVLERAQGAEHPDALATRERGVREPSSALADSAQGRGRPLSCLNVIIGGTDSLRKGNTVRVEISVLVLPCITGGRNASESLERPVLDISAAAITSAWEVSCVI
jgi:hypothetical protein